MKFLKHILLVIALLATMVPCGHAIGHHDHDHGNERYGISAAPCECHSCEHTPCADDADIQADRTSGVNTIVPPSVPVLLFVLPETKPALKKFPPPVPGVLATLKTVRLLI